jgi:hypothetical protein
MKRYAALLLAIVATGACGGGSSPATPSIVPTPAPTPTPVPPLQIIDGITGQAVTVAGAPARPGLGEALILEPPGYLLRQQKYEGKPVTLWPGDQNYVNGMVYPDPFSDGIYRLIRWSKAFTITLDGDLANDDLVNRSAQETAAELRRTTGLAINVGPGGECVVRVNPTDPVLEGGRFIAYATPKFRGAEIIGGAVVFINRAEIAGGPGTNYRNTLLHEFGHIIGLGHSGSGFDVMNPGGAATPGGKRSTFSDNETALIRMIYFNRKIGNRPPDADPGLFAASVARPLERRIID